MTKQEVIQYIAENSLVEEIVRNIGGDKDEDLKDLVQDIYINLYTKSEKTLVQLYETNQLKFFITRIVINNIHSTNSRFYYTYKKNNKYKVDIDTLDVNRY